MLVFVLSRPICEISRWQMMGTEQARTRFCSCLGVRLEIQRAWKFRSCCLRQTLRAGYWGKQSLEGPQSAEYGIWGKVRHSIWENLPSCPLAKIQPSLAFAETQEGDGKDQGVSAFTKSGLGQKEGVGRKNKRGFILFHSFEVSKWGKMAKCCCVTKSSPTLCDPMDCSMPGLSILHYLPEFDQIHVNRQNVKSLIFSGRYTGVCYMSIIYFGHLIRRANSLEKTLMLGTIKGKRRRGRQKMRRLE